jgi:hypothetical protein
VPSGHYERTPKQYQRPTITARLLFLEVGECAVFTIKDTLERMLSEISTTWNQREVLRGMQFKNETHLLARQGEIAIQVVVTTRIK